MVELEPRVRGSEGPADKSTASEMLVDRYGTSYHKFRSWPDIAVDATKLPLFWALLLWAIIFFLVGAVVALPFGFLRYYAATPAVYLGCVGFALTLGGLHWGSQRIHSAYERLRPIFLVDDDKYAWYTSTAFRRMSRGGPTLVSSLCVYMWAIVSVYAAYFVPPGIRAKYHIESIRPPTFNRSWFEPSHRFAAIAVLLALGAVMSYILGTAIRFMLLGIALIARLRSLPMVPVPTIVRSRLRQLVDLYVSAALQWSAGLVLFVLFFYGEYDTFSITFLTILFVVGLATFSAPQFLCRRFITSSYEELCSIAFVWLHGRLGIRLHERKRVDDQLSSFVANDLANLSQIVTPPRTWVYESQDILLVAVGQIAAFLAVFAHDFLTRVFAT